MVFGRMNRFAADLRRLEAEEQVRTGTIVLWTPGSRCSCVRDDGQVSIGCRVCDGFGWFWRGELETPKRAILVDGQQERQLAALGIVQRGDLAIVFDRRITRAAPFDRVRLNQGQLRTFDIPEESEIVVRAETGAVDRLTQRIVSVNEVSQSDPTTGVVTLYRRDTDFTYSEHTNLIAWVAGHGPAVGTRYAVSYLGDYDWVVTQPPLTSQIGDVGVQRRMVLKRRFRDQRDADRLADDPYQEGVI